MKLKDLKERGYCMNDDYEVSPIVCSFMNNWRFKSFALGIHLSSESFGTYREYYILLSLTFWQVALGVRLRTL